ncbi:unnamed protein product [Anisakis simplex]|uniref:Uncharacterized protein n=1 Tax=Anisakis simplex TaxID=6269 RepID=A0A0M3KIT0_ANISI|nr:unnamed protein product [Anisakis simplex]
MSQFFWQTALQNPAPQNEPHQNRVQNQSAVPSQNLTAPTMTTTSNQDDIGWSSIGLANNAPQQTNHSMQQPQQLNQQHFYTTTNNPSITASEYSSLASDPYGAAVLQGYSASSASGYQFAYQTPPNSQTEQLNYVVSGGYENAQNNNNKNNFYGISEEDSNTLYHNQVIYFC